MSIVIDRDKCFGCVGLEGEARCTQACPGDLIYLDEVPRAVIREPRDCWDCMACVKACPAFAIQCRLPYAVAAYKATLSPKVKKDTIEWTVTDPDGSPEVFVVKTFEV